MLPQGGEPPRPYNRRMTTSREIRLAARPRGVPAPSDFELAEVELRDPGEGEVLIRNAFVSVDPYMRGRMNDAKSYVPPFQVGEPLTGGAVGQVAVSRSPQWPEGAWVVHNLGSREWALGDGSGLLPVDPSLAPVSTALRVIGSAGTPEKVAWVRELGFDEVFDYRETGARDALREGIDVYFDNVGGPTLEAAIGALRRRGRVVACGAISQYNATEPQPGPRNLFMVVTKRLRLEGFIIFDHYDRYPDFLADMGGWLRDGKVRYRETVVDGIEHAPEAFVGLLQGDNVGKMLVRVGPAS